MSQLLLPELVSVLFIFGGAFLSILTAIIVLILSERRLFDLLLAAGLVVSSVSFTQFGLLTFSLGWKALQITEIISLITSVLFMPLLYMGFSGVFIEAFKLKKEHILLFLPLLIALLLAAVHSSSPIMEKKYLKRLVY